MTRKQRGFGLGLGGDLVNNILVSLIIFAVIAVVAWNLHTDYRAQHRVQEGLALAAQAQAAVEKVFAEKGPADFSVASNEDWTPPASGEHVQFVSIAKNGAVTVRYTASVAPEGENEIQLVPVADGNPLDLSSPASRGRKFSWECGGAAGKTTVPQKHRPARCRQRVGSIGAAPTPERHDGRERQKDRPPSRACRRTLHGFRRNRRKQGFCARFVSDNFTIPSNRVLPASATS